MCLSSCTSKKVSLCRQALKNASMFLLEVDKQRIFLSPQVANSQNSSAHFFPLLQIRKFIRCASPQIANPKIFMISPQTANPQISTKYCTTISQNSHKSCFVTKFFVQILIRALCAMVVVLSPALITKNLGPQIRKVPHLREVRDSNKFADLRFVELISVPPPTFGPCQLRLSFLINFWGLGYSGLLSRYFLPVPFPKDPLTCYLSLRKVKMSRDRVKTKLDKSGEVKAFSQVAMSNNHAVIDYCRWVFTCSNYEWSGLQVPHCLCLSYVF